MSRELLLLLLVFVVFPLIQELLRARRRQRTPEPGTGQPAPRRRTEPPLEARTPEVRTPLGRGPAVPRVPATPRRQSADAAAHKFTAQVEAAKPEMPALLVRPDPRQRQVATGLRNSSGLRRGIVLMTILGPSRAMDPYGSPERAARR